MKMNLEKVFIQMGVETVEIANVVKAVPARIRDIIQNFETDEVLRLFNVLIYIHVTRNTYPGRGVLLENCKESDSIDLLRQLGLVDMTTWGSKIRHTVVIDTDDGRKISEILLIAKIRALNFNEIRSTCHPIIFWICRDMAVKSKEYTLPTTFPNKDPFNQADRPISWRLLSANNTIFDKFKEFADILVKVGVVGLANGFNSNNIWDKEYVFPEETDAILEPLIKGFDPEIVTKIESLLKAMDHKYRAIDFLYSYDPQAYQGLGNYRQAENEIIFYLRNLGSSVKVVPETFSKGFGEKVPFIILNRKSYKDVLSDFKRDLMNEANVGIKIILTRETNKGAVDIKEETVIETKQPKVKEIIEGLRKPELKKTELPGKPTEPATINIRPKPKTYRDKVYDAEYDCTNKKVYMVYEDGKRESLNSFAKKLFRYPINVWLNWEYLDNETNTWRLIDELRKEQVKPWTIKETGKTIEKIKEIEERRERPTRQIEEDKEHESEIIVGTTSKHRQEGVLGRIGNANVVLDFYEPHAVTILGVQGSGKSYAAGVIIEMALKDILGLSKIKQPLSCIIFHFSREEKRKPEWLGLVEANNDPAQVEMLKQYGASPSLIPSNNINIFVPPKVLNKRKDEYPNLRVIPLSFSPSKLKAEDWQRLLTFGTGSDALYLELIKEIMIDLRDVRPEFGAEDLIEVIEKSNDLNKGQKQLAKVRIKTIGRWLDEKATSLDEYLKPGVINVVDFRDPLSVDEKMAAVLLQTLFSLIKDRPSNEICLVCIDEAHLFLRNEALTGDIVEFVKLLRKDYRVYLLLISQHPKDFHPDILGLSDIILCHRLDDSKELNFLKEHQSKFSSVIERIKELNTKEGEAYIWARVSTNSVLNNPQLIRIRPKATKDKGRTATAF